MGSYCKREAPNYFKQLLRSGGGVPSGQHLKPADSSLTLSAPQTPWRGRRPVRGPGVWGPLAWDPWGFTLRNNRGFRAVPPQKPPCALIVGSISPGIYVKETGLWGRAIRRGYFQRHYFKAVLQSTTS